MKSTTKLGDFEIGDILILTYRHKNGVYDERQVYVTLVDYRGNGHVTWSTDPYCGAGAFMPFEPGSRGPYGLISVKHTGRKRVDSPRWYPTPGNTGYDLMC